MASNPTSPRRQGRITRETPVHQKSVHGSYSYQTGKLVGSKKAVLDDLGQHVPQVTFQDFLDHLAPHQPKFNLEATMETLRSDPEGITPHTGRWRAFGHDPKDQLAHEDTVFEPMPDIFHSVVRAIIANSDLTLAHVSVEFLQNPTRSPTSNVRQIATKPDGYMVLKEMLQEGNESWNDIFLSCEYKRKDGVEHLNDNVSKCIWSMQRIMKDDPCRRAMFGMTFENTNTRVWFCCRSSSIVSESFSFIFEPEGLVKLFAAFAFADKKSLGFDPTIERISEKQFIVTVHPDDNKENPRRFRTKSIISSYGAEPLRGRGTRVFDAVEIDQCGHEKGPDVVLKDIWIDTDRVREGAILSQLYNEAKDHEKTLVPKYFLTTICHGDVWMDRDVVDDTEKGLMHKLQTTNRGFILQVTSVSGNQVGTGSEGLRVATLFHDQKQEIHYVHKTHYRIVFKEKGTPIGRMPRLHGVMATLIETVDALRLLRRLGWVHRDVSIGNILSCQDGAKLADLEYAKKTVADATHHGTRTGTIQFMSVEAAVQIFLFRPTRDPPKLDTLQASAQKSTRSTQSDTIPWSHNHLHDLESLWWVAVWMVVCHHFCHSNDPLPGLEEMQRYIDPTQALFPPSMNDSRRQNSFQASFLEACKSLPENKEHTFLILDALRQYLIMDYKTVQSTLPASIDLHAAKDKIYELFEDGFGRIKTESADYKLYFIPKLYAELEGNRKRPREESISITRGSSSKRRQVA